MNKKTGIIIAAVAVALIGVVALTLLLLSQEQDTRSSADNAQPLVTPITTPIPSQTATTNDTSCPTPGQVQNVLVEFPNCEGDQCNFTQASCSWASVAGATKYQLKITEVESGAVVKDQQVEASITRDVFAVNANKTYKCDVSAINSCGTSGVAGSHSLFCEVDALVETPSPTTPPAKVACGSPCTTTDACESGLVCAQGASGQGYCAIPSYQAACQASPSVTACCTAPTSAPTTPAPTVAPTGNISGAVVVGATAVGLLMVGALLLLF